MNKLVGLSMCRAAGTLVLLAALLSACCPAPVTPPPIAHAASPAATLSAAATAPSVDKEGIAPEAATGFRQLDSVSGSHAMVAAANPHAARAGMTMLERGGSAADAAVAMAVMLTLVEPQSSGIGGGAFLLHFSASERRVRAYDGRETAPGAATADQFLDRQGKPLVFRDAVVGGLSVGVPGELRMLELVHQHHGKLPWKTLFEPTIALARTGFAISPRLHHLLAVMPRLPHIAPASSYFYRADGSPRAVGSLLKNPKLADTLAQIADGGADVFYQGAVARDIAATVQGAPRHPGRLALADLKAYRAVAREPVCAPYRGYRVCGMPPPTSGGVAALQILGLLQRFDMPALASGSLTTTHLFAEASRLAYADRDRYLADPDFVKVPVAALLDPAYLARRSQLIAADRSMGVAAAGVPERAGAQRFAPDASLELPSTSHFVAVDSRGDAVSITASIESAFGSHLMVHGFLLNNELTDFSFVAHAGGKPVANRVQAGKRPRSSMTPLLVLGPKGEQLRLAVGSPGGSRIIDYVTRVLIEVVDHGLDVQQAIAMPNVVNRNGVTELERVAGKQAWIDSTRAGLTKLGHQVEVRDLNSGLHAIERLKDGSYRGGADPRREGVVLSR